MWCFSCMKYLRLMPTHPVRRRGSARTALWPGSPSPGQSCSVGWGCASASWSLWPPGALTSGAEDTTRYPLTDRGKNNNQTTLKKKKMEANNTQYKSVCLAGGSEGIRDLPISRRAASMTAAPFNMVAIKMSWPGQSTNDTCLGKEKKRKSATDAWKMKMLTVETLNTTAPWLQSYLTSLKLPLVPGMSEGNSSGVLLPHDL